MIAFKTIDTWAKRHQKCSLQRMRHANITYFCFTVDISLFFSSSDVSNSKKDTRNALCSECDMQILLTFVLR